MPTRKKILISGAGGLMGRHALMAWQADVELHALVHTPPLRPLSGVTYHPIDLACPWDTSSLPQKIDAVLHLAQSAHMREFPEKAHEIFMVNTHSTSRLLDYARRAGATRFIFASTGGLYAPRTEPLDESAPIAIQEGALAHYFASKYAGELLVRNYAPCFHTVVLRPFFVYGPGQRQTMLIPRLIARIRQGEPITLQGKDGIAINPLHVSDAVACLEHALTLTGHHTINLAGAEILRIKPIAEIIGQTLGQTPTFEMAPPTSDTVASITQMCEKLVRPRMNFAKGIQELCGVADEAI